VNRPSIPEKKPGAITIRVRAFDVGGVRRYCAGLESLARELKTSSNPAVIHTGLAILELHPANVRWLLSGEPA
jgi:hypothetical protein